MSRVCTVACVRLRLLEVSGVAAFPLPVTFVPGIAVGCVRFLWQSVSPPTARAVVIPGSSLRSGPFGCGVSACADCPLPVVQFVVRTGVKSLWITDNRRSRGIFELTGLSPDKVASPQKFFGHPPQVHRLYTPNRLTLGSITGTMTLVMSPTNSLASGRIIIIR